MTLSTRKAIAAIMRIDMTHLQLVTLLPKCSRLDVILRMVGQCALNRIFRQTGVVFDDSGLAGLDSGFAAGFSELDAVPDSFFAASAFGASSLPTRLRFLSPSFLKSVSYQPLPASRNAGAVTRRRTCAAPQSGQLVGSGSDNFCKRSKRVPQVLHSNS